MALPIVNIESGTLVSDPELKFTPNGHAVANFRVASNSRRKNDQTGQWENADTTFVTINAWNGLAENIATTFHKGDKIDVKGFLKQREWEKDGQKRTVFEVEALNVSVPVSRFADSPKQEQPSFGNVQDVDAPF